MISNIFKLLLTGVGILISIPVLSSQTQTVPPVKISGQVKNLQKKSARVITPIECNPVKIKRHATNLDSLGRFSTEMNLPFGHDFTIYYDRKFYGAYAEPGDSLYIEIDATDLNSAPKFSGDRAEFNNQFSKAYKSLTGGFYKEFSDLTRSTDEFREDLYRKIDSDRKVIAAYSDSVGLRPDVRELIERCALFSVANTAMDNIGRMPYSDRLSIFTDSVFEIGNDENCKELMYFPHVSNYLSSLFHTTENADSLLAVFTETYPKSLTRDLFYSYLLEGADEPLTIDPALFSLVALAPAQEDDTNPQLTDMILNDYIHEFADGQSKATNFNNLAELLKERYAGKYIYLDLWATWCGPCLMAHKSLPEVAQFFKDDNVVFVSVAMKSDPSAWRKMLMAGFPSNSFHYIIPDDDSAEQIMSRLAAGGFPSFYLIAPDGSIVNNDPPRPGNPEIFDFLRTNVK